MANYTGLSSYAGKGVNVTTAIKNIISKTSPTKTINAFGTNGNTYIESGQSTRDIVNAGQVRMSTPTLQTIYPSLQTNFQNINSTFKSIQDAFTTLTNPSSQANPNPTTPNSPGSQNTQNPNQPPTAPATSGATGAGIGDQVKHSLDSIKNYVGPTGLIVGAVLVGLLIVTRGKRR